MAKKKQSYESAINELESILEKMENDKLVINELSKEIKRASELIKFCKTQLKSTELDIKNVLDVVEN